MGAPQSTDGKKRSRLDALKQFITAEFDLRDAHAYLGIILVAVGLVFVYWPLSLIAPGALFIYMGLFHGRRVD